MVEGRADDSGVRVRPLRSEDWDTVVRIYREGIETGNATFETTVSAAVVLDAKWIPGHRWVAEVDGEVAGWCALTRVSERACYAGVAETSIYVGSGHRGRGVGRTLIDRQVAAADADEGLWTLQTSIFPENRASIALHHRAGFRTVGIRERIGRLHRVWRDTVLLERRCAGTATAVAATAGTTVQTGESPRNRESLENLERFETVD
ncbi:MAG TPA: GNAT family N-acetyltransferase [Actinopolymorphaceae bacterium]